MYTNTIYIGGFSYVVGEKEYDIERLRSLRNNAAQVQKFKDAGFAKYRATELSIFDLAENAINQVLRKTATAAATIDAFIFATSSLGAIDNITHTRLCEFMLANGLVNAFPLVSSFSFCGNFLTAVHKAHQGMRAGDYKNVLVVTTDVIADTSTRIAPPDIAVGSDGAAACLLSVENNTGYALQSIHHVANAPAGILDPDKDFLQYTKSVGQGIRAVAEKTFAGKEETRQAITKMFTHNYSTNICRSYCRLAKIPESKVSIDNVSRYGHVCAADLCINLCDYLETHKEEEAEQPAYLLLSTGPFMWGSALITATKN